MLFVVAKNDKKMRIEVGYGLEGALTDVTSRRIIAENVAPHFREGEFAAGIDAGVDRIIAVVGRRQAAAAAAERSRPDAAGGGFDFGDAAASSCSSSCRWSAACCARIFGKLLGSTVGAGHRRRGRVVRRRLAR